MPFVKYFIAKSEEVCYKSVKEITKLEKTSLSDFTLCEQSFFTPKNAKSRRSSWNEVPWDWFVPAAPA